MTSRDGASRHAAARPQQGAALDESGAARSPHEAAAAPDGGRLTREVAGRRGAGPAVARQASALQRQLGNQHVIGMLHSPEGWTPEHLEPAARETVRTGPPIQRYAVNVPASGTSEALFNWLQANSPHRPAWALTSARFTWSRSLDAVAGEDEGTYIVTVADSTVGNATTVDMPTWTADNEPMRTAWGEMWNELRAHEAEHEAIATEWQTTLQENLAGTEYVITASSAEAAKQQGLTRLDGEWTDWIALHQADQTALDTPPFFATLNEPPEEDEESSSSSETAPATP